LVAVGRQRVAVRDGVFSYDGGELPLPPGLAGGAVGDAVLAVPGLRGVVGVDFVRDETTGETTVIEINPRPTTSYVGLVRLLPPGALARAWLAAFSGDDGADDLRGMIPAGGRPAVAFRPDGTLLEGGNIGR
jgi:predicted ATP-grasp superfamily ATP-dependent carboligase